MEARFDLVMPDSREEALALLAEDGAMPLAGGTNLVVDLRAKRVRPKRLVSLDRVSALRGVSATNGQIAIGARTTVTDLLRDAQIGKAAPALVQAASLFAGQMVRNTATVAGNIACGSPAADLVPPLLSLDATVMLHSAQGERTLPLADFFVDYHKNALRPGEIISAIGWERLPAHACNLFYKLARRKGDAITITGVAVTLVVKNGFCTRASIALGAVAPIVFRAHAAETMLEGEAMTPALINAAAAVAAEACRPIDDVRASARYRRDMVRVLTRRLLSQAAEQLS